MRVGKRDYYNKFLENKKSNVNLFSVLKNGSVWVREYEYHMWCPTGVRLGPQLIYFIINDICRVSEGLKFVDDLNIFFDLVTKEMDKLKSWFEVNELLLNLN